MYIHQHQKVRASKDGLELLGFTLSRSSNSRSELFWEVKDNEGKDIASTLNDSELCRLLAEVLICPASDITSEKLLKNRSL